MIFVTWLVSHSTLEKDFIDLFYKQWRFPAEISIESLHIHANSPRAYFHSVSGHVQRLSCGRKWSLEESRSHFSQRSCLNFNFSVEISFNCARERGYMCLHRPTGTLRSRWNVTRPPNTPTECRWEKKLRAIQFPIAEFFMRLTTDFVVGEAWWCLPFESDSQLWNDGFNLLRSFCWQTINLIKARLWRFTWLLFARN